MYINDIFDILKNGGSLNLDNDQTFNALVYADDLISMSSTQDGLQKSLNALVYADDLIIMSSSQDDLQKSLNALVYADDLIIMSSTQDDLQKTLNALVYADDLIIMSSTQDGLQKSLNALNEFCKKWKLNINQKKTKCMTFSKGLNTKKDNFTIDSKNIANTKVFKYLGITINCKNCTFTQTLTDLSIKASKGIYSLFSKIPTKTMLNLFDTGIIPILLYGSVVWAPFMNHDWV